VTFAADRLAVDEHRAGIEVNPVPCDAQSFADTYTPPFTFTGTLKKVTVQTENQ
jgi:hypothetical protein